MIELANLTRYRNSWLNQITKTLFPVTSQRNIEYTVAGQLIAEPETEYKLNTCITYADQKKSAGYCQCEQQISLLNWAIYCIEVVPAMGLKLKEFAYPGCIWCYHFRDHQFCSLCWIKGVAFMLNNQGMRAKDTHIHYLRTKGTHSDI